MSALPPGVRPGNLTGRFGPDGRDRRRRRRVKLAMPVRIWGGLGSIDSFEDVGKTIDASRDGLLVATGRGSYWPGQFLDVRLGGSAEPAATGAAQRARVIRNTLLPNRLSYAIALEFQNVSAARQLGSGATLANGNVLFVESDHRVATLVRTLLEEDGYHVLHATNATEALQILGNKTPDVLLAGTDAADISGQDLCWIVKRSARLQHVPVILLTRSGMPSDYSDCHGVGAVLCMATPCAPTKLHQAVRLVAPPREISPDDPVRKVPRYPLAAAAEITDAYSVRISARVAEISRKGCYVDVLHTLPVGTLRKMRVLRDSGTFVTTAKVIYTHDRIGMGMAFVNPPPSQLKLLDSWLAEFAGHEMPR